jgi:hypothetical protein
MFDFKKITGQLFEFGTPDFLRDWIKKLVDKIETVEHEKKLLQEKNEQLEAEIRRLKGLPAKPVFNASDKTSDLDKEDASQDNSTEGEKKPNPGKGKPRRKKKDLKIDITKKVEVNASELDATFEYKGTRQVIVQEILFQRNNIAFELEKFYSKEYGKTVEANLPAGYEGGYFGPNLIAFILCSYYEGDVTIKKIHKVLKAIGIFISLKQINRIINNRPDELKNELEEARVAGIEKVEFQQIDDTHAKVLEAESAVTIVTCNPYFTNLTTTFSKSRSEAVLALAGRNKVPLYKINDQAILVAAGSRKSFVMQVVLSKWKGDKVYSHDEVEELFCHEDFKQFQPLTLRDIKTAMLVGAFYDGHLGVKGKSLVSDDAGQFNNIYDNHSLCWPHEIRHYKDLSPVSDHHKMKLLEFFAEVKFMYRILKEWIQHRRPEVRDEIFKWFNTFFKAETGYKLLDERKAMSFKKIDKLLAPLWTDVKLPLTNNESERDLRGKVVKRKISLFDKTWKGAWARDLYISLKQTCHKNGVSFYNFLVDRKSLDRGIPQLAEIIKGSCPQH